MNKRFVAIASVLGVVFLQGCSQKKTVTNPHTGETYSWDEHQRRVREIEEANKIPYHSRRSSFSTTYELEGDHQKYPVQISYSTSYKGTIPYEEYYQKLFADAVAKNIGNRDAILDELKHLTEKELYPKIRFGLDFKSPLSLESFVSIASSKYPENEPINWFNFVKQCSEVDDDKLAKGVHLMLTDRVGASADPSVFPDRVVISKTLAKSMLDKAVNFFKNDLNSVKSYDFAANKFLEPTELTDTVSAAQDRAPGSKPRVEEIDFRFNLNGDIEDMARTHGWTGSGMVCLNNYHFGVVHSYANQGVGFQNGLQTETSAVALAVFGKIFIELQSGLVSAENLHKANWTGTRHLATLGYDFANSITPFVQVSSYRVKSDREDQITNPNGNKLYVGITVDAKSKEYALNKVSTIFTAKAGIQSQKAIYSMDLKQNFISQDGISLTGVFKVTNNKSSVVNISVGWSN